LEGKYFGEFGGKSIKIYNDKGIFDKLEKII